MATVYASPLTTVVLQLRFLPAEPPASQPTLRLNPRPYEARGWTTFEDLVTREVMAWLQMLPDVQAMLVERDARHKFFVVEEDGSASEPEIDASVLDFRESTKRINDAAFTGTGDKPIVIELYSKFRRKIARLMSDLADVLEIKPVDAIDPLTLSGVRRLADKSTYTGAFEREGPYYRFSGQGVYEYSYGARYVGEYMAGLKHGRGEYSYPDGAVYTGQFATGKNHGFGTHVKVSLWLSAHLHACAPSLVRDEPMGAH